MLRRHFLAVSAAAAFGSTPLSSKERVDRGLSGKDVDRPPFSLWHHFGLKTPDAHAARTLEFHRSYKTDLVKVMSDFPYPRPSGKWYELKVDSNPYQPQITALEQIRNGLGGRAYFVETIFNSWNVAEKLSSKGEMRRLKSENPTALLSALEAINASQIHHAKRALAAGASGIFLSVANANAEALSRADYIKFSLPFDRKLLEAVSNARLNTLHLHVDADYLELFADFPAPVVNYSLHVTGIPMARARSVFRGALMGGIDERNYKALSPAEMEQQWKSAAKEAGPKFLLSPGCSVPDDSTPTELSVLPGVLKA